MRVCVRIGPVIVALSLLAGCGGSEDPWRISWDLSRSHDVSRIAMESPHLNASELAPVESVRIRVTERHVFAPPDGLIHDVTVSREGDQVRTIQVDSHPVEVEEAYELAVRWAKQFALPLEPLEAWYRTRTNDSEEDDKTRTATNPPPDARLDEDGPVAYLKIRNSFLDDEPVLVSMHFFWNPRLNRPRAVDP